jgi:hypothetical protein
MAINIRPKVAYGLSEPNFAVGPFPIISVRDPFVTDFAEIGTLWINSLTNTVWALTAVVANQAAWVELDSNVANTNITWHTNAGAGPIATAINSGYYLTNAGAVTLNLPVLAAQGSQLYIATDNSSAPGAGFTITQNAGQYIIMGNNVSTPGIGGSIDTLNLFQISITMHLICTVANTEWTIFDTNCNPFFV